MYIRYSTSCWSDPGHSQWCHRTKRVAFLSAPQSHDVFTTSLQCWQETTAEGLQEICHRLWFLLHSFPGRGEDIREIHWASCLLQVAPMNAHSVHRQLLYCTSFNQSDHQFCGSFVFHFPEEYMRNWNNFWILLFTLNSKVLHFLLYLICQLDQR